VNELSSENLVALCDVDAKQGGPTFEKYRQATRFKDFRRMLDEMGNELDEGVKVPGIGALVIGDHGTIMYGSPGAGGLQIIPGEKMAEYKQKLPPGMRTAV
jgi:hypothetical protein